MKYTKRDLEKHRYTLSLGTLFAEERPEWLSEYDKGVNDGKVWRYDYVFWIAVIAGLCFSIGIFGIVSFITTLNLLEG